MTSKVGHILSIRYSNQPLHYPIIAQFRSKQTGLMHYVIPLWNATSKKFIDYREDSHFMASDRSSFSKEAFQMSEQHKACARAFRLQMLLKKSSKRVNRAKNFVLTNGVLVAQKSSAGHWGNWPEFHADYLPANEKRLAEVETLHVKLDEMFRAEMALAKITI